MSYGTPITVAAPFADTMQRVRDELQAEGFGVLTEINVTATLREKLGVDIEDYVILGACNPTLAHQALQADRSIGLLLPCNVVVRTGDDATVVEFLDPQLMSTISGSGGLSGVADEAAARLSRVMERLSG
jgi:uncharacterized protein (DUF302 family)